MRIRAYSLAYALLLSGSSVATLTTSTPAAAQTADAMTEMARQRFQEGVTFYDAKDYEKARAAFLQAYALKKHPSVLLNLAQSELRSGHEADAAQHFDQYLRENPSATAVERQEAEKGLAAARGRVAEVTITAPAGAQIFVDGEPVGAAPLPGPVFLPPGNHKLEARKDGASGASDVVAAAGAKSTAALSLGGAPATAGAGPTPGAGEPGAGGATPPDDSGAVSVNTQDPREPFLDWYFRGPISWIGSGAFGVGLIGGIAFAVSSSSSYSSADNTKAEILKEAEKRGTDAPCSTSSSDFAHFKQACAAYQDNVDAGDTKKTVATVGFVLAGLGAATVVGGYFLTAKKVPPAEARAKRPKSTTVASPVITDDFTGFALSGSF